MRFLGIDYGTKRVGVAISDEAGDFVYPYAVLLAGKNLIGEIKKICIKENVSEIVVGESLNYGGKPNPIMKKISGFAEEIAQETNLPVRMEKEFLTSAEAERLQGKNRMHDASAAAIILKSYLGRNK